MKRGAAALSVLLCLCLVLTGCGPALQGPEASSYEGIYRLVRVEVIEDGSYTDEERLAQLEATGFMNGIELREDGTGELVISSVVTPITWEVAGRGTGTCAMPEFDMEGLELALEGDTLTLDDTENIFTFSRDPEYDLHAERYRATYPVGIWRLVRAVPRDGGDELGPEYFDRQYQLGQPYGLELLLGGTGRYVTQDTDLEISWVPDGPNAGTLSGGGEELPYEVVDGELVAESEGGTLHFMRDDSYDLDRTSVGLTDGYEEGYTEQERTVVADNELVTIAVVGKGIYKDGTPYVSLEVTNNGDADIYAQTADDSFTVDGRAAKPILACLCASGTTEKCELWLKVGGLEEDEASIVDVRGTIEVYDHGSGELLGTLDISID